MTPNHCTSVLDKTLLFQKLNICQNEKQRHQNLESKLSGCNKIINFCIGQILLQKLNFMKMCLGKSFHILLSRNDIIDNHD